MSNKMVGRCTNFGNCDTANSQANVEINESEEFICPECGKSLDSLLPSKPPLDKWKTKALIVLAIVAFGTTLVFALNHFIRNWRIIPGNAPERKVNPGVDNATLRLVGSDTFAKKLAPALIESFFKSMGCSSVTQQRVEDTFTKFSCRHDGKEHLASIRSNTSASAFIALKDGSANVGMTSRRATPAEVKSLLAKTNLLSPANEHIIGLDGIAIIIHPANQLPRLSIDQIRSLFSGKLKSFNQVGGINKPVSLYRLDANSGIYDSFSKMVMSGLPISAVAKSFAEGHELSAAIVADVSGLGFVGYTDIGDSKAVPIGWPGRPALLPNRFTIQTEDYPLTRRLYLYAISETSNTDVTKFISFVNSKAGQSVVERENFVPLAIVRDRSLPQSRPLQGSSTPYPAATLIADRLSVNFRFNTGSNQLDNRALSDLDRMTEFLLQNSTDPKKLILVGFTDDVGDPASNLVLSKQRANAVADALRSRGVIPGRVTGFGSENPVASNSTPDGRERNRRVEVWVSK